MMDGSTDISGDKQEAIYIRCCKEVVDRFLGIGSPESTYSKNLKEFVIRMLDSHGIDKAKLVALGSDGASDMTGHKSGLAQLLRQDINQEMINIHCFAHRLELSFRDVMGKNKLCDKVMTLLIELSCRQCTVDTLNNLLLVKLQSPSISEFNPKDFIDDWLLSYVMPRRPHYNRTTTRKRQRQTLIDQEEEAELTGTVLANIDEKRRRGKAETPGTKEGETGIERKEASEIQGKEKGNIEGKTRKECEIEGKKEGEIEVKKEDEAEIVLVRGVEEVEESVSVVNEGEKSVEEEESMLEIEEEQLMMRLDFIFKKDADEFDFSEDY